MSIVLSFEKHRSYSTAPGQYNCYCPANFYGHNCTFESKIKHFGQVLLQYNHVASINGDNNFLIILTDLGTALYSVEMVTSEYAIAALLFPLDNPQNFIKTNDIQAVAKKFNVPSSSLPPGNVFYYAGKYRMGADGITIVSLTITGVSETHTYYTWNFQFGSLKNVGCNPLVTITNW